MTNFTDPWNATYESLPPDTEARSLGAQRIRNLKVDVRERMAVDHSWDDGLTTASNDGKHLQATLRISASKPTLDTGDGAVYSKVVAGATELFYEDSAGNEVQITSAGQIAIATFPSGTVMPFYQATPPIGWTQVTGHDDRVFRIHDAGGGADGGSWTISGLTYAGGTAATTVASHTLSEAEMPVHSHTFPFGETTTYEYPTVGVAGTPVNVSDVATTGGTVTTATDGSGGGHTHNASTVLSLSSTIAADGNWRPAYANFILASKN